MQLICFECKKEIDHRGRYFEVKVFEWSRNIGHQVHGYVWHPEHFPLSGGIVTVQVT